MNSSKKAALASAKSAALPMPVVHTRAIERRQQSSPTTAALTPVSARPGRAAPRRRFSQKRQGTDHQKKRRQKKSR